jgi:three-Cys-motif partner protein
LTRHEFGGDWTEVKLAAIEAYSRFFTSAIGRKFDLWYVDPFAGTGSRTEVEKIGAFFDLEPATEIERQFPGSAARALGVAPPFHHYRFGDADPNKAAALEELVARYPGRDAMVIAGDANSFIQRSFRQPFWTRDNFEEGTPRALVFLDPYGMEVQWDTLRALARCQKADVWFLANLGGAVRQLAHDQTKIDDAKRRSLNQYFGSETWEADLYQTKEEDGLLGLMEGPVKRATKEQIAAYHRQRLQTIFTGYVSEPLPLQVGSSSDYFLLYCMSNNPWPNARGLIQRGANWVINQYKLASHQRSAP